MRCDEFELVLQQSLDGEPSAIESDSFQEHANRCDACRELQEGMRLLAASFPSTGVPHPPAGLTDRICAAASCESGRKRTSPIAYSAAAAILLGAACLWSMRQPDFTPVASAPASHAIAGVEPEVHDTLFPELAGPNTIDARKPIPIMNAVEPVSRVFQAVGKSLGGPVRPIAVSASEAMGSLIRDLPDSEAATTIPIPMMREMMNPPDKKMQRMNPSS
jgi:hypothetical protein